MSGPRIASLAPSATATLVALGAAAQLVGVTAQCELDRPVVGGWLNPDLDRLEAMDPDLVCTSDPLQAEIAAELRAAGHRVHHSEPATLAEILETFRELGTVAGRPNSGDRLVSTTRERLDAVDARVADRPRPVVYCEEWSDPPMVAGNWVPDAVRAAGGRYPFVESGARSREVDREAVERADPEHAVLHICGFGERVDPSRIADRDWAIDPAVHVVDDSLLNQPSPRLIDGVEELSARLHPDA
ncbi:cobalamin-binding protein [Haloferacaceae archaeon DSL9]